MRLCGINSLRIPARGSRSKAKHIDDLRVVIDGADDPAIGPAADVRCKIAPDVHRRSPNDGLSFQLRDLAGSRSEDILPPQCKNTFQIGARQKRR